ncbi:MULTISPECIES: SRPBCC family protein [unclassified Streptomyces]|uniref:SRPBCC family protein n=1 Tax=unclassified Streptomyces TaxID=2593676 RepID=UPI001F044DE1|nr:MULTISPECIES: SRPBCC family protein [unclassified Streptomyces]MCH0567386.1 SRPBCC family protein [Streptomyces sp. MUM 2J]MCH0571791.1 SRPBCC family protein [Streptomyces sp. MUM 136J]
MELHHEFTVPVPLDDAWQALLDIERVAPCLPGASVEEFDGKTVTGSVKVKVGPVTVTYKGTAVFEEQDEQARRLVLAANGRETRGQGTARARVTAALTEDGGATTVSVRTDLTVTGRPAQFGRGVLAEVGDRLVAQFASCLAERIAAPGETATTAAGGVPSPATAAAPSPSAAADEPIDLFRTAGVPIAKRAAMVAAAVAAAVWAALRIRRWARH